MQELIEQCGFESVNSKSIPEGRNACLQCCVAYASFPFDQKIQKFHIIGGHVLRCQPQLAECVLAVTQAELADIPHHGGDFIAACHHLAEKRSAGFGTFPQQRGAVERGVVALFKGPPGIMPCGQLKDIDLV